MATSTNSINVDIVSREMIKPSSATPDHLKLFKFSKLDQMIPLFHYTPLVLFYTLNQNQTITTISQLLKSSLSKNLSNFYPFAGRIKDHVFVECNDQGVEFIDARIGCHLSDLLRNPDLEKLNILIPHINVESMKEADASFVYVQLNVFKCGAIAICIRISHKLADTYTIATFIKGWTTCISTQPDKSIQPNFSSSSLFPPINELEIPNLPIPPPGKSVQRRFVFSAKKLLALKAKLASANLQQPTAVEALSALIWKCSMTAKSATPNGMFCCNHVVNLRRRFSPPLPENIMGNLLGYFSAKTKDSSATLQDLVYQLRKEIEGFSVYDKKNVMGNMNDEIRRFESTAEDLELVRFYFSSWCKYPFYEADFGWGKPLWVTLATSAFPIPNTAFFLDAKEEGGIEVLIWLSEQDMDLFMCNEDFLEFATLNPSVLAISRSKL